MSFLFLFFQYFFNKTAATYFLSSIRMYRSNVYFLLLYMIFLFYLLLFSLAIPINILCNCILPIPYSKIIPERSFLHLRFLLGFQVKLNSQTSPLSTCHYPLHVKRTTPSLLRLWPHIQETVNPFAVTSLAYPLPCSPFIMPPLVPSPSLSLIRVLHFSLPCRYPQPLFISPGQTSLSRHHQKSCDFRPLPFLYQTFISFQFFFQLPS